MTGPIDSCSRENTCETAESSARPPSPVSDRRVPSYNIRAELASRHGLDDVRFDLTSAHGPRISELKLTATATLSGRVVVTLTIDAADLWVAMLTCMAVIDHNRFDVIAWSAETDRPNSRVDSGEPR